MDIESIRRWWDYTAAYQRMIAATHTPDAPWYIVPADDKRRARLSLIRHLLDSIPYKKSPSTCQRRSLIRSRARGALPWVWARESRSQVTADAMNDHQTAEMRWHRCLTLNRRRQRDNV